MTFTEIEKQTLLALARESICKALLYKHKPLNKTIEITETLLQHCGAFVSLHRNEKLRGCIGCFEATQPLFEVVKEMALSAAFHDYRFPHVTASEIDSIRIEISVLTPLKKIDSIDEIQLGKHGIYIEKGYQSGTFLPQVAIETHWTKEEFLGHCSMDKAGLEWNSWQNADLYIYEAIVFSE